MNVDRKGPTLGDRMQETAGAKDYFDAAAATWDENPTRVELAKAVAGAMLAAVPLTSRMAVMDFGCGTGLITRELAPKVASVTAADTSVQMLAVLEAKAKASGLEHVRTLLLDDGYPKPSGVQFDAIVSSMVFHHIEDIPSLLSRFAQWVRPGGWIAVADLEPEDGTFHRGGAHEVHHGIDPAWLGSQIETVGFSVRSIRTVHTIRRQGEGADRPKDYPVFLLVARC
jgi:2-polyprenyl-3-methyl-5-hydroxy-6-metoxy-1,4-benzoquinol methylase